jgi:hypothetical protein
VKAQVRAKFCVFLAKMLYVDEEVIQKYVEMQGKEDIEQAEFKL